MPYPLNNVTTANAYTTANTLECPRGVRVQINVSNAAVFYQIGFNVDVHKAEPQSIMELLGAGQNNFVGNIIYGPEVFFIPRSDILTRICDSIRVRSAVAGKPAQVTITAWKVGELVGIGA